MLTRLTNFATRFVASISRRDPEENNQNSQCEGSCKSARKSTVSKSTACLIAVSAFLIGVEAGHMNQNTLNANATNAAIELCTPSESGAAQTKKSNIPPKEGKRIYNATRTTRHNGKEYLVKEKYEVFETKQKVEEFYYEKGTNKLAQHSTYGDYLVFPMIQVHKNAAGRLIESRRIYNFNRLLGYADSAIVINQNSRVKYTLDMKTTSIEPIEDEWTQFINSVMPD